MTVRVQLWGPLRAAAETGELQIPLAEAPNTQAALRHLAGLCPGLKPLLFDEEGGRRPSLLLFADGRQLAPDEEAPLREGSELNLLYPISGG